VVTVPVPFPTSLSFKLYGPSIYFPSMLRRSLEEEYPVMLLPLDDKVWRRPYVLVERLESREHVNCGVDINEKSFVDFINEEEVDGSSWALPATAEEAVKSGWARHNNKVGRGRGSIFLDSFSSLDIKKRIVED